MNKPTITRFAKGTILMLWAVYLLIAIIGAIDRNAIQTGFEILNVVLLGAISAASAVVSIRFFTGESQ